MTPARKSLLEKIKALLAKTVANGCTEAEAMAALAKAGALMEQYEITNAYLDFGDEQVFRSERTRSDRDRVREMLCVAVGHFTHCRCWMGEWRERINFCGLEGDVGFAEWLLDMLADFVDRELQSYLMRTATPGMPRIRRRETEAFVTGCCERISARLRALAVVKPSSARGLVIAKDALIEARLNELGIHLTRGRSRFRLLDGNAHAAGEASGDHANFDRPIETGATRHAIEGCR